MTTTPKLYLRGATFADVNTIFRWRRETAAWLRDTYDTDQWSTNYPRKKIEWWVRQGSTVMATLEPDGPPVATITVTPHGDPELWTAAELELPARYINKANVQIDHHGLGIGACLITWARSRAALAGVDLVRFDVWSTNRRLQDYYTRMGFQYLRTVPGVTSGALFEGPALAAPDLPIIEAADVRVV